MSQIFLTLPGCWKPETVSAPRESSAGDLSQQATKEGSDAALTAACAANLGGCSSGLGGDLLNPSQGNPTGSNSWLPRHPGGVLMVAWAAPTRGLLLQCR